MLHLGCFIIVSTLQEWYQITTPKLQKLLGQTKFNFCLVQIFKKNSVQPLHTKLYNLSNVVLPCSVIQHLATLGTMGFKNKILKPFVVFAVDQALKEHRAFCDDIMASLLSFKCRLSSDFFNTIIECILRWVRTLALCSGSSTMVSLNL